jgi:hypothetical protein
MVALLAYSLLSEVSDRVILFPPLLFILGSEALSRLLYSSLRGFRIARSCTPLNHLLFADDLVLFSLATSGEAALIQTCLDKYNSWSGQTVNIQKSTILFSKNTAPATILAIQSILPYELTTAFAKHLGLPLLIGKSKAAAFSDILENVQRKIDGWRFKTLSQVGKIILVKVVASAIPSYTMSSFLLTDSLCHKLDTTFKNFWWGFPKDKSRNLSLKSWHSLCLPKDQGGLGFRLMKDVNISLISKLGWNLLTNHSSIWVSLFQQKYIKYGNLLSSPFSSGSWIWNGIIAIVPLLSRGACFLPCKNSSLPIWTSPWIPTLAQFIHVPPVSSLPFSHPLAISDLFHPFTSTWNASLLIFLFHPHIVSEILKITINHQHDSVLWTPSTSGAFSTQSAHHFLTSPTPPLPPLLSRSTTGKPYGS